MGTKTVLNMETLGLPQSDSLGIDCYVSEKGIQGIGKAHPDAGTNRFLGSFILNNRTFVVTSGGISWTESGVVNIYMNDALVNATLLASFFPDIIKSVSYMTLTNNAFTYSISRATATRRVLNNNLVVFNNGVVGFMTSDNELRLIKNFTARANSYEVTDPNQSTSIVKFKRYQLFAPSPYVTIKGIRVSDHELIPREWYMACVYECIIGYGLDDKPLFSFIKTTATDDNVDYDYGVKYINPTLNVRGTTGDGYGRSSNMYNYTLDTSIATSPTPGVSFSNAWQRNYTLVNFNMLTPGMYESGSGYNAIYIYNSATGGASTRHSFNFNNLIIDINYTSDVIHNQIINGYYAQCEADGNYITRAQTRGVFGRGLALVCSDLLMDGEITMDIQYDNINLFALQNRLFSVGTVFSSNVGIAGQPIEVNRDFVFRSIHSHITDEYGNTRRDSVSYLENVGTNPSDPSYTTRQELASLNEWLSGAYIPGGAWLRRAMARRPQTTTDSNSVYFTNAATLQYNFLGQHNIVTSNISDINIAVWGSQRDIFVLGTKSVEQYQISDTFDHPLNWVRVVELYDSLVDWCSANPVNRPSQLNKITYSGGEYYINGVNRVRKFSDAVDGYWKMGPETAIKGIHFYTACSTKTGYYYLIDDMGRLFRVDKTALAYAIPYQMNRNNFYAIGAANGETPHTQHDLEGCYPFTVEWINRTPDNCQIKEIAIETTNYEDISDAKEPIEFKIESYGKRITRTRASINNLVKFFNFGRGGATRYRLTCSGYLKSVSVTDTKRGQQDV